MKTFNHVTGQQVSCARQKAKNELVVAPGWRCCKGPGALLTFTRGEKLSGSAYVLMSPLSCPFGHCGESSSLSAGCSG